MSERKNQAATRASELDSVELADLADELRAFWRTLSRGVHLSGGTDQFQRQQSWVLSALTTGPRRMSELAECARTSQASLTGIVDRLESLGFVERIRSAEDRRVVEVALTEAGLAESECVREQVAERLRALIEPLSAREAQELRRLLRKMTHTECVATPRSS